MWRLLLLPLLPAFVLFGSAGAALSAEDGVVSNIHNAPGWRPGSHYSAGERVVNGPGWRPSAGFKPGAALAAYKVVSGSCTSGQNGGPNATGANISDGSCVWKFLSGVDYISITGWAFDNVPWAANTSYFFQDYVVSDSPLKAYRATGPCTSGANAPTGAGKNISDGGCVWNYVATIGYSSQASHIPTQRYPDGLHSRPVVQLEENHTAIVWGDREYVAGQNGERDPIVIQAHADWQDDNSETEYPPKCATGAKWPLCGSDGERPRLTLRAAPGDSFRDKASRSSPLAYNPSQGVAIHNVSPHQWGEQGSGLHINDSGVALIGLQVKADHATAVNGTPLGNYLTVMNCIADGNGAAGVSADAGSVIGNSLIINRSEVPGSVGAYMKYGPQAFVNNTVVHPGPPAPNGTGLVLANTNVLGPKGGSGPAPNWKNNAVFGFPNGAAVLQGKYFNAFSGANSANNATDSSPASANPTFEAPVIHMVVQAVALPGVGDNCGTDHKRTCYSLAFDKQFSSVGSDWRTLPTADIAGAGAQYDDGEAMSNDGDILGAPRSGRYDIGAWQSGAVAPRGAQ
jgi:hypothetical protein